MTNFMVAGFILIMSLILSFYFMSRMPGRSFQGPLSPLTAAETLLTDHLQIHVETLAGKIGERNIWEYKNLQLAAEYIEGEFKQAGLQARSISYTVEGKQVRNIEVEIPGAGNPSEIIIVGAHYDSLINTSGANDNGTGVAALIELARFFSTGKPNKTLRFVAFVNEEPPFFKTARMGSLVYVERSLANLNKIVGMISLETIGYYSSEPMSQKFPLALLRLFYPNRGDFLALVGNFSSRSMLKRSVKAFRQHSAFPSEGIIAPGWLVGIDWSDQWSFWKTGHPAIMVTDTAIFRYPFYHDPDDTPDKVNYDALARVVTGLQAVIAELCR